MLSRSRIVTQWSAGSVSVPTVLKSMVMQYGVRWLPSDFKKRDGYLRSIRLAREYGLYRQDWCGCVYSKRERERRKQAAGGV